MFVICDTQKHDVFIKTAPVPNMAFSFDGTNGLGSKNMAFAFDGENGFWFQIITQYFETNLSASQENWGTASNA